MDELMISGRRYLSASRAAKEYGYHSDYIGQLIRGGKVKGQKVGRAWYVDAESLAIYLGKEVPAEAIAAARQQEAVTQAAAAGTQGAAKDAEAEEPAPVEIKKEAPEESVAKIETNEVNSISAIPAPAAALEPETRTISITKVAQRHEGVSPREIIEEKSSGLVYVSDEEPMLPRIQKERVVLSESVERPVFATPAVVVAAQSRGIARRGAALALIGIAVLTVTAALSSLLVFSMSVGSTQTAGVKFSVPK